MDPLYKKGHCNLGNALAAMRKYDEAIHSFKEAVKIDPNYQIAIENIQVIQESLELRKHLSPSELP